MLKRCVFLLVLAFSVSAVAADPVSADGTGPLLLRRIHVPVLMYHYISNPPADADAIRLDLSVTPNNFEQQMQWLNAKGYTSITPDQLLAALTNGGPLPDHPVLITFDDGYIDDYTNALPTLKHFGFVATFFVVTSWIDQGLKEYLSWDQAKEMVQDGMSVQNHTVEHKDMRNRDHDWLVYQILGAEESIEAHTGVRPRFFCYPSGDFDDAVLRELRAAGVEAAFTTNDGAYDYSDDVLRLPRVRIHGSTSLETFAQLLTWER